MRRTLFFTLYILLNYLSKAQQIEWAKNTSNDHPLQLQSKGLLVDSQGNIYNYGSYEWGAMINGQEAYFSKYSSEGQMSYTKTWPFRFSKVIYDGGQFFYAVGSFSGQAMPNNLLMKSRGGTDGFIAKLDLNGNFIWVKCIGAHGDDVCKGVTLNEAKTNLIVTGGCTDSLYVNSNYVGMNSQRSMLLARFDLQGNVINHSLSNFDPSIDQSSCGYEIECDHTGNFIVFAYKEGASWSTYSTAPGTEGYYLCKYNSAFTEIWSHFIINGSCYYGFSCGGLSVDDLGNSFIPSYCSGKYGGQGILRKFDANGVVTWSLNIRDASGHKATCVNGNLFLVGSDGVNGCPCPDSHTGYAVIRKLDQNYSLQGETKIMNVGILNHAVYHNGYIFIAGYFNSLGARIGNDTLSNSTGYNGSFIARLKDVNCTTPATDSIFSFWKPYVHCPQTPVVLDAGAGHLNYEWNNGATTQTILGVNDGAYSVKIKQASGCVAYSLPVTLEKSKPYKPDVIVTTYDNVVKRNRIAWTHYFYDATTQFKVYKTNRGDTSLIATIAENHDPSWNITYTDSLSNKDTNQVGYYVTRIDTCGTESEKSLWNSPIFLRSYDNKISWTPYFGFNYTKFYIFKGQNPDLLAPFAETDSSSRTLTLNIDTNSYYQVKVKRNDVFSSVSNIVKGKGQFLTSPPLVPGPLYVDIFPNPSGGVFHLGVTLPKEKALIHMSVVNVMGKEIKRADILVNDRYAQATLDLTGELRGIYFVILETDDKVKIQKRIVVQQ
jgi:hypothetical protein